MMSKNKNSMIKKLTVLNDERLFYNAKIREIKDFMKDVDNPMVINELEKVIRDYENKKVDVTGKIMDIDKYFVTNEM